jgi:hypothetical protein
MPKVVIRGGYTKAQVYVLAVGETCIGRDTDQDLVLPHTSVSRNHAVLSWDGTFLKVEDKGSSNGVMVNQRKIPEATLSPGDHVQIGDYNLHVVTDEEAFFEGRYIAYMSAYSPTSSASRGATMMYGNADIDEFESAQVVIEEAMVVRADDDQQFWHPEELVLTFGKGGLVPVDGMFTGGVVAEVVWDKTAHVLRKKAALVSLKVDGASVKEARLSGGEILEIGNTSFVYQLK